MAPPRRPRSANAQNQRTLLGAIACVTIIALILLQTNLASPSHNTTAGATPARTTPNESPHSTSAQGHEEPVTEDVSTPAPTESPRRKTTRKPARNLPKEGNEPAASENDNHASETPNAEEPDVFTSSPGVSVSNKDGTFRLANMYPMHEMLPSRRTLDIGIKRQLSTERQLQCLNKARPVLFEPPKSMKASRDDAKAQALEKEYEYTTEPSEPTFFDSNTDVLANQNRPWWVPLGPLPPSAENPAPLHDGDENDVKGSFTRGVEETLELPEGNLPCTEEVQQMLYERQHPASCDQSKFLVSRLKEGAHGIGSALTLVVHDFLSAIIVGRVLVVESKKKWYFAADGCGDKKKGWECLFVPPSHCPIPPHPSEVSSKQGALNSPNRAIRKKNFDIPQLGRNDIPTAEQFFGHFNANTKGRCYTAVQKWVADPANTYLMGTFKRGADPMLFYMMSQVLRYLMRTPQPWFQSMLKHHLNALGVTKLPGRLPAQLVQDAPMSKEEAAADPNAAQAAIDEAKKLADQIARGKATLSNNGENASFGFPSSMVVYVQERGEIAKYREYYNAFGCHTVKNTLFVDFVKEICTATRMEVNDSVGGSAGSHRCRNAARPGTAGASSGPFVDQDCPCGVFVSGNTPIKGYRYISQKVSEKELGVLSTWQHPKIGGGGESARWGASAKFASWVDLYAGVAATGWVCTVQSNWCRVINMLRLTSGRAACPFIDVGTLMMSSGQVRESYCVVNNAWPTKPFSGRMIWKDRG